MKNRFAFIAQHKYRKILDKCKKYSVTSRTVFIGTYLQGTLSEVLQIIPRRSKKEHKKSVMIATKIPRCGTSKNTQGLSQKIQAIYFKIQGTYFKIYALYFSRL